MTVKLVRDLIPEKFPQHAYRCAYDREVPHLLRLKLMEEAGEVVGARNRAELLEELADVLEVIRCLADGAGVTLAEVDTLASVKRHRLGGFDGLFVLTEYREG